MIRYKTVGLLYTRTCPLSCRHCIIESSPKVSGKMDRQLASDYLKVIQRYASDVCFTGGEPMLYYNEVLPLIREAKELGLNATMVTGAGWVSLDKPQIARERIAHLKEAGLDFLTVSWDLYHEECCPPEKALLVVETAKEVGLNMNVRGVMPKQGPVPRIEEKLVQIEVDYQKQYLLRLGSAANLPEDHFVFGEMRKTNGCSTVLLPAIEPDGSVYACCGPSRYYRDKGSPLYLGNTNEEDLDTIFERATNDPILEAIATVGPYVMFNLIKDDPSLRGILPVRDTYTGICELCLDLNDVPLVVQRLRERLSEDEISKMMVAARLMMSNLHLRPDPQIPCPM